MKILAVNDSPHKNGNTVKLIHETFRGAHENTHECEVVRARAPVLFITAFYLAELIIVRARVSEGKLDHYLQQFSDLVVRSAVDTHPQIMEVIILASYPIHREIWCVFIYDSELENSDSKFEMWTNFWEDISRMREIYYSEYKKPGLGYITLYPLFLGSKKFHEIQQKPNDDRSPTQ